MALRTLPAIGLLLLTFGCSDGGPTLPPPSPHHLSFVGQPTASLADSTITPAITVEVRDSVDRRISGATAAVTIGLGANAGTAMLSGSTTLNAVNGAATFINLKVDQRGRGYTLVASSGSLTGGISVAFDVYAPLVVDVVAAGSSHTFALKRGVATYCLGTNAVGGLSFREVSNGFFHSCGLTTAGEAYCWGGNNVGQLGDSTRNFSLAPVPTVGGLTFQALHGRNFHTCAIATSGAAYCWGVNNQGELGDSTHTEKLAPQAVLGGHTFLAIAAGSSHSCGIATDATTYCWGDNQSGQLGDGTGTERRIPTRVIY